MNGDQEMLIRRAIEFVNVRDALLDMPDEPPSLEGDLRAPRLEEKRDLLLRTVTEAEPSGESIAVAS